MATREATQQIVADEPFAVVTSGAVNIHVEQRYALDEVMQAHRELQARQTVGSGVLLV